MYYRVHWWMLHDWHHRSIYLLSVCGIGWSSVFKSWDEVRTSTFIPHYTDSNIAPTYWQYFKGWIKHSHILKEKLAFLILYSYFISTAFFECFCVAVTVSVFNKAIPIFSACAVAQPALSLKNRWEVFSCIFASSLMWLFLIDRHIFV